MKKPRILTGPFYFTRQSAQPFIAAKLPEMFRAASFNREAIDKEARTVPIIFATEAPVERWFGRERLICTPEACNLERLNTLGAMLSEHDRERQIGVIVKDSPTFGIDHMARATVRFSKSNPLAEQEWKDVLDEIRGLWSVGYVVNRLLLREENEKEGDLYDAVDWSPLEISLVSIPADTNCTVDGREEKSFTFPVRVTTDSTKPTKDQTDMLKRSRYFARFFHETPNEGAGAGASPGGSGNTGNAGGGNENRGAANSPGAGNQGPTLEQAREAETIRIRELGALGARFGCMDEMVVRMGKTGAEGSVEAAYKYILDNGLMSSGAKPGANGGGNKPLFTQGDNRGGNQPLSQSIGALLVASPEFRTLAEGKGKPDRRAGFQFPVESFRTTVTTGSIEAGTIVPDRVPGVLMLQQQRLTVADLLAQGTTSSNKIEYIRETLYTNAATTVAEGAPKPEATFTMDLVDASVRKIAVTAKISDEMLSDFPYIQSYVDNRLRFMIEEREELQLLSGDGNSPNLLGLTVTPDVQTQAMGADSAVDAIYKGITKVRVTGRSEPTGIVVHPTDWQDIRLSKDNNGQYLAGGPFYAPYGGGAFMSVDVLWGLPVVVTTNMTEGTAFVGAFRTQAQIFRRKGITIETTNSNEDDFKNNLIAIRAEERLAVCCYRPTAFVLVTGI